MEIRITNHTTTQTKPCQIRMLFFYHKCIWVAYSDSNMSKSRVSIAIEHNLQFLTLVKNAFETLDDRCNVILSSRNKCFYKQIWNLAYTAFLNNLFTFNHVIWIVDINNIIDKANNEQVILPELAGRNETGSGISYNRLLTPDRRRHRANLSVFNKSGWPKKVLGYFVTITDICYLVTK